MKNVDAVIYRDCGLPARLSLHGGRARRQRRLYVEKPFANIMSDARAALKLVLAGRKQIVQVGTQRRSTPSYMRAYDFSSRQVRRHVMAEMTWKRKSTGPLGRPKVVPTVARTRHRLEAIPDSTGPRIPSDARSISSSSVLADSSGIPDQ